MKTTKILTLAGMLCLLATVAVGADGKKWNGVWTSLDAADLPADYAVQGEYEGKIDGGGKIAAQVIALGNGHFQAVLYPGGLPGAGWDGEDKILLDGKTTDGKTTFEPAAGKKRYLGGSPAEFSATSQFPPKGQKPFSGAADGKKFSGKTDDGKAFSLQKVARQSPSIGKTPPEGAIVLFDGTNTEEWNGGRLAEDTKFLHTDGSDILTKRKFNNYLMHLEFMMPYRPAARGQGRGNSGFYQVDHYEVQILDSFGLDGKNNECGGIYSKTPSLLNMCLPPLTWQTYDVEFTNAVAKDGKKVQNAKLTIRLNGVVIHKDLEIDGKTGGSRGDPEGTPGPIKLQGHGNPLQFRNVWIVEK